MARAGEGTADEGGEGYFASISDLMVGILFVFLLMLTVFALNFRDAEQEQMIERARYEEAKAEAIAAEARAEEERRRARLAQAEAEQQAARAREQEARANSLLERNQALQAALDRAVQRLEAEVRGREEARAALLARLAEELEARGVAFRLDQRSGVLRLSEDVPFETGRSDLTDRTRRTVQVLAEVLARILPCFARAPERHGCAEADVPILEAVFVEGHTDRQVFRGMSTQQSQQENDRLSTARALGLTLTRANRVIHLARWWNPAVEDQCTGRVLRIGQTRPVMVHLPLALLHDGRRSFDQNLHALLERKRALMRDALMPPAATDADREELLSASVADA